MNPRPRRPTATEAVLFVASLCFAAAAAAAPTVALVTQVNGPLIAQTADGRTKALARGSVVEPGDRLITGTGTYAEVLFADDAAVTLQPETQLAVGAFSYDAAHPGDDRAEMTLAQGGVRVVSGAIAARSSGRHTLATGLGTIAVSKSTFIAQYSAPAVVAAAWTRINVAALSVAGGTMSDAYTGGIVLAQGTPTNTPGGGLAAGLYVHVIDGVINLTNRGGSTNFSAGQFGYTSNLTKPPVVVPNNPGIKFTPPPAFSTSTRSGSSGASGKPSAVDCEVR